jgi:hypothetical protein
MDSTSTPPWPSPPRTVPLSRPCSAISSAPLSQRLGSRDSTTEGSSSASAPLIC